MNNNEAHSPVSWANRLLSKAERVRGSCPPVFSVKLKQAVRGLKAQMPRKKTISDGHATVLRAACIRLANVLNEINQAADQPTAVAS